MKRLAGIKYLIVVLIILSLGFLLAYMGNNDMGTYSRFKAIFGADDSVSAMNHFLYAIFFIILFLLMHKYLKIKLPEADPIILSLIALLSGIGMIMIMRLSPDMALSRFEALSAGGQTPNHEALTVALNYSRLVFKQLMFITSGILLMIFSINIFNKRAFSWLSSKRYIWVFLSALIIIVTLVFGTKIHGRSLWLLGFQTVEVVKFMMILFIAGYIYEKGKGLMMQTQVKLNIWNYYTGPFIVMCFFALAPIFIQGDIGPTFLMFLVFLVMFHCAGNRHVITVSFLLLILAGGYIAYAIGYPSIVRDRFDMMLDPFSTSESVSRALWSLASGGVMGKGIGYGQPYRIPAVQSDYSFTAICEEMGFIGGMAVILCYVILLFRIYTISSQAKNIYKKSLVSGIGILIGFQALIIILGNLSKIPLTGITLPFVSYGGSSMLVNFLMAGIVLRISGEKEETVK